MNIDFIPTLKILGRVKDRVPSNDIKNEPMVFQADWDFASRMGGPLTRRALSLLRTSPEFNTAYQIAHSQKLSLVVDTRVNNLTQGWYPVIPGWHCDDVPRPERNAQPDFSLRKEACQHFAITLSDTDMPDLFTGIGVSGLEFLTQPTTLALDKDRVWESANNLLNDMLDAKVLGEVPTQYAKDGELVQYSQQTLYRVLPARLAGWQFFLKCSLTDRKVTNEIRKQSQVYLDVTKVGW